MKNRRCSDCRGLTLLEVILALAILSGAVAVISQAAWSGLDNARRTRDFVRAELLAENLMNELLIGSRPLESVSDAAFDAEQCPDDADRWTYAVEISPTAATDLLNVRVTVRESAQQPRKVEASLVRWIFHPSVTEASVEK